MPRLALGVLAILMVGSAAIAEDIVLCKGEIRIPTGQSKTFEFGSVPQKDTTILLDVLARLDSDGYGARCVS
jgi:hypothetical protein